MPKINREEYEILISLDEKWKWIARDKDRGLYAFTEKPVRKYDPSPYWDTETEGPYTALELIDEIHLFQFIQWEDEEPYNIQELIDEYLDDEYGYFNMKLSREFEEFIKKSEEAEVKKDKKWAQKEVDRYLSYEGVNEARNALVFAKGVIDQLDEPDSYYAYQKGFREGERQTAEYFESVTEEPSYAQVQKYLSEHGIKIADKEPETVADVVTTFWKSYERLKEVMSMEVEELEE